MHKKRSALTQRLAVNGKTIRYGIVTLYDNFYSKKFLLPKPNNKPRSEKTERFIWPTLYVHSPLLTESLLNFYCLQLLRCFTSLRTQSRWFSEKFTVQENCGSTLLRILPTTSRDNNTSSQFDCQAIRWILFLNCYIKVESFVIDMRY